MLQVSSFLKGNRQQTKMINMSFINDYNWHLILSIYDTITGSNNMKVLLSTEITVFVWQEMKCDAM